MALSEKQAINERVNVTKTFLPPIESYHSFVQRAWDNEWLTNRGELILELEEKLRKYLNIDNILIMNNGTIPIQIALKLIGKCGEVITTPFSYVATTSSIIWENCTPVFVDIEEDNWTLDPRKIEQAITSKTTCILATHVFGNPCDIEAIDLIAKKYNLKVIYDAAHCFGVEYKGNCVFKYGDVSTCSFHATKVFHTGEGGAVFCEDAELRKKLFYSHNFGHDGPLSFHGLGINGKISELQASMGLAVLPHMNSILDSRKSIVELYLQQLHIGKLRTIKIREYVKWNYSYFPVVFNSEEELLNVQQALNNENIFPRRYFFPSLNTINYVTGSKMPTSESIASRILCLPLYFDLKDQEVEKISKIVNKNLC